MKTVRDGRKVWPYCPECGCRLELRHLPMPDEPDKVMIGHFGNLVEQDARGCFCSKLSLFTFALKTEYEQFNLT